MKAMTALWAAMILLPAGAMSSESPGENTLGAYIKRALERNPQLAARKHMVAADKEKIGATLTLPDPALSGSFSAGRDGITRKRSLWDRPSPGRDASDRIARRPRLHTGQARR